MIFYLHGLCLSHGYTEIHAFAFLIKLQALYVFFVIQLFTYMHAHKHDPKHHTMSCRYTEQCTATSVTSQCFIHKYVSQPVNKITISQFYEFKCNAFDVTY